MALKGNKNVLFAKTKTICKKCLTVVELKLT